jgi:hypothetical protein
MMPPSRLRPPPAYQEYASDILAKEAFVLMEASERGLLWSVRLRCWVDGSVPANHQELARVLGIELSEVEQGMTSKVIEFLAPDPERPERWIVPELENYRAKLYESREKQRAGGSRGGKKTAEKRSTQPQGYLVGSEMRRDDMNRKEAGREGFSEENLEGWNEENLKWRQDYESESSGE